MKGYQNNWNQLSKAVQTTQNDTIKTFTTNVTVATSLTYNNVNFVILVISLLKMYVPKVSVSTSIGELNEEALD